jgi:hypothetical protein
LLTEVWPQTGELLREIALKRPDGLAAVLKLPTEAQDYRKASLTIEAKLLVTESLFTANPGYDADILISMLAEKSKKLRQYALSFLMPRKELAERIRPLLSGKKDLREAAETLIAAYEGSGAAETDDTLDIIGLCTRSMPKNGREAIKWAFPGELPSVRRADADEPIEAIVAQYYFVAILGVKSIELPAVIPKLRVLMREEDLHAAAVSVYGSWMADGAPAKQRGALLLYGYHAKEQDVLTLRRQIDEWAERSRGAIAADAVRAMALGGSDLALMTVDSVGRKFKNKQVKTAGITAFAAAAQALGTTAEALGDRIIPTLGFDLRGEKIIDYGNRRFTAMLDTALSIVLKDENGKLIKSLPKPGARDDAEKAEAAKAEFSALKKSLKTIVDTQRSRLEQALATGRSWNAADWEKLFVRNPIMHSFAETLIWGSYKDGSLVESFRYMNDGSFTTVDEDEYALREDAIIGLVHPLELDEDLLTRWRQQLEDYEITQAFGQIDRSVFRLEPGEEEALGVERFGGKKLLGITLLGRLQKNGWYKGSVQDAGAFYTFYREIGELGAQLYFSGMYVSPDLSEEITVGQLIFYRAGSVARGSYVYDDVARDELIAPGKVPARLFSELLLDVEFATASAETDENWLNNQDLRISFRG